MNEAAVFKTATISQDGVYRYTLTRTWDTELPTITFVMLNPSTADADLDDPTIRRCIGFARREGCGTLAVVNLFAYRATDPRELARAIDPVGPENDEVLASVFALAAERREKVVAAWGAYDAPWRVRAVRKLAGGWLDFACLGTTKDGHPKHPLYLSNTAPLEAWLPRGAAA